jgi:hypothetical protein
MAEKQFITIKLVVGIYLKEPYLKKDEVLPVHAKLLAFPEFDGFSTFSPPQTYTLVNTAVGSLSSSNNVIKAEVSQASVVLTWYNATHDIKYQPDEGVVLSMVERVVEAMGHEVSGVAEYREYLTDAPKKLVEGVLNVKRHANLKQFLASMTYPGEIGDFKDLDITYSMTDALGEETWAVETGGFKHSLNVNTSMRYEAERVLTLKQIKGYVAQVLKEQTGSKVLADITDGGE